MVLAVVVLAAVASGSEEDGELAGLIYYLAVAACCLSAWLVHCGFLFSLLLGEAGGRK